MNTLKFVLILIALGVLGIVFLDYIDNKNRKKRNIKRSTRFDKIIGYCPKCTGAVKMYSFLSSKHLGEQYAFHCEGCKEVYKDESEFLEEKK